MKRDHKFLFFLLVFCLAASPVFADNAVSDVSESVQDVIPSSSDPAPVVVDLSNLVNSLTTKEEISSDPEEVIVVEPQLVNATQSIQKVSASDATGFKAVLLDILGDYETVITDYEYRTGSNTYTSHSIAIERDYAWLASACMLGLLTFCTFKFIGGLLCNR